IATGKKHAITIIINFGKNPNPNQITSKGASTITGTFCDKIINGKIVRRTPGMTCNAIAMSKPIDTPIIKPKIANDKDALKCGMNVGNTSRASLKMADGAGRNHSFI